MSASAQTDSAEIQQAIFDLAKLAGTSQEVVLKKAQDVQRVWGFSTIEDGVLFLCEATKLENAIKNGNA